MSTSEKRTQKIQDKWGPTVLQEGYTTLPTSILRNQSTLKIKPLELVIIAHLASYWWDVNKPPYPSKGRLAACIGVHPRTVQRSIAAMERKGLIRRVQRRVPGKESDTNFYLLDGLIHKANQYVRKPRRSSQQQEDVSA